MSDPPPSPNAVLVAVFDTPATRRAVEFAARRAPPSATLHLVAVDDGDAPSDGATARLVDARRWASHHHGGRVASAGRAVETGRVDAAELAATLAAYASHHDVSRAVVPADAELALTGVTAADLADALADAGVPDPTVGPALRVPVHRRLTVSDRPVGVAALFVLSFGFYLLLAGTVNAFEVVTGAATAAVVAAVFGRVTFASPPTLGRSVRRTARWCLYVPYLLWAVTRASLDVAAVVLDPRLPVDPRLVRYRPSLEGDLPLVTFANSVTLTPGTLTVDVDPDSGELLVHTLTAASRADLRGGSLERAVRFVFEGRPAVDAGARDGGPPGEVADD